MGHWFRYYEDRRESHTEGKTKILFYPLNDNRVSMFPQCFFVLINFAVEEITRKDRVFGCMCVFFKRRCMLSQEKLEDFMRYPDFIRIVHCYSMCPYASRQEHNVLLVFSKHRFSSLALFFPLFVFPAVPVWLRVWRLRCRRGHPSQSYFTFWCGAPVIQRHTAEPIPLQSLGGCGLAPLPRISVDRLLYREEERGIGEVILWLAKSPLPPICLSPSLPVSTTNAI